MPTTIPFDPSLVLGNIVPRDSLEILEAISTMQADIDAAEDNLNAMISAKRSLQMTVQELDELGIDTKPVRDEIKNIDEQVRVAANDYAATTVKNALPIRDQKRKIRSLHQSPESPIDYNRTEIKKMPLSADSLKMNVQYFSFDQNSQTAANFIAQIGGFVSDSLSVFGNDFSSMASAEAKSQTSSQVENHEVVGTLVMSLACTHKDAAVLAPFVLDVDKAVRVWNAVYPDNKLEMDAAAMAKLQHEDEAPDAPSIGIISGATYGSSFVGMVHQLRSESTRSTQSMASVAASMQETFDVGGWFASESGGFGVDTSFSTDIKNLLSSQNITSHVSLVTMGAIPSIKSSEVQVAVKTFSEFDPAQMMGKLAALANATEADHASVTQAANAAKAGGKMVALESAKIESVMSGLGKIDDANNKILDINSMMTALQDYVDCAKAGQLGVPVNYYVKKITKLQLAQMWVAKYMPGKYIAYQGDDTPVTPKPSPAPEPVPGPAGG